LSIYQQTYPLAGNFTLAPFIPNNIGESMRKILFLSVYLLPSALFAVPDLDGIWLLDGPGTESEIILTVEGQRIRDSYDLLEDDPSLSCVPASASRVWANPGSRVEIVQEEDRILISYELFDLRREIPIGDTSVMTDSPSTRNLDGTYFPEMGSSFAHYEGDRLVIESRNHVHGYIRTSRGIPQGSDTITLEELEVNGDRLHITHTYSDETIFEEPLVLEYFLNRLSNVEVEPYNCTDADYDWFLELNANKEDSK